MMRYQPNPVIATEND